MLRGWIRVTSLIHRILWGHSWLEIGSIFSWKPLETQKYMCPFQAVNMFLKHLVLYLDLMILLLGIQKKILFRYLVMMSTPSFTLLSVWVFMMEAIIGP